VSRSDWDEAERSGHLTPEHVLRRLSDILEYALGNGADAHGVDLGVKGITPVEIIFVGRTAGVNSA
jgi:hypothetical protein